MEDNTLAAAARRVEQEKQRKQRIARIINTAAASCGIDRMGLAVKSRIEYQTLNGRLRGESDFRSAELTRLCNALELDDRTRAVLLGAKGKCRFEAGWKGDP